MAVFFYLLFLRLFSSASAPTPLPNRKKVAGSGTL